MEGNSKLTVEVNKIPIKINPRYEELSYDPTKIYFKTIRASIRDYGQHYKIIINEKGEILDGHKRFKVCKDLGITPKTEIKSFDTPEQEEVFVIDCNLSRSHHPTYERVVLCEQLYPIIKKDAEQRQRAGKKLTFTQNCVKVNPHYHQTDSILARKAGISANTYRKYRTVINSDDVYLKDKVKSGKISISAAYNIIKKYSQKIEQSKIPKIQHTVIVANPTWINKEGSYIRGGDYPQIIKSCSDENSVFVLCVSNKHMPDAFELIRNSGFKYHHTYTQNKKFIIVAKRGNITLSDLELDTREIHEAVESAFPSQKYVELWADKEYSDKWTVWDETVTVSVPENIPECRRPMQSTMEYHCGDLWG